jgi:uncharacterized protein (TIRG00374 family)
MRSLARYIPYAIVFAFALWCLSSLRSDLAQLSPSPLLHAWDLVALATLLSLVNYALRILRWRFYLARLGHPVPTGFAGLTFIAGFAYTLSPGKFGEMVRARYYLPRGIPLPDVAASFFTERLMDLVAMIVLASLLFSDSSRYAGLIVGAAAGAVAVLVSVAVIPWARVAASATGLEQLPRVMRRPLAGIATALASSRTLVRPAPLVIGFLAGLLAWSLEGVGFGLLTGMFPTGHLAIATAVGIYGVAVLAGGLSFLPGGLGSTEAVMTALMVARGIPITQALLVTLTCRLATLWLAVGLGWLAVFALRQRAPAMALPWR